VVLIQPSPIDGTTIYMACVTVKPLQTVRGVVCGGLTQEDLCICTAPIWRRRDEILSIAHVLRDHAVLIQPSPIDGTTIYMACVTVKPLQTVRGVVCGGITLPPWIAMDSYQLIAPSIKMFDSYPDSYHKDAFDSYHRDSLDSYHRDSLDSYPQGHHRDTLNYTKYA
jgi:hypothetical protein